MSGPPAARCLNAGECQRDLAIALNRVPGFWITCVKASGRKVFFFEKKQQKTFGRFGFGLAGKAQPRLAKVFWFFFSKKSGFLCR
jgi:hypothetical protein